MTALTLKNISLRNFSLPSNLQPREKMIVAAGGGVLVLFIIFQLIIFPIFDRRDAMARKIQDRTQALQQMQQLAAEYTSLTLQSSTSDTKLRLRPKNFTLFSYLDILAGQSGIKQNIGYMKPSKSNLKDSPYNLSMVEMKMTGMTMDQLIKFLHGVETSANMIWIKRISLSREEKNSGLINAILQVETFQL
ncbi:MAG: hypothetical protein HKP58_13530 [Desulfatitalea sp.]|nr:type II secretion system protein M [Desulfatitalea sp.]NNK01422.1 hypothetical protein [Desulfatitalea sp.]